MANGGGGGGGAPAAPKPPHLREWRRILNAVGAMLRKANVQLQASLVERSRLETELDFERRARAETEEIYRLRIRTMYGSEGVRERAVKAEAAVLLGEKDRELCRYQKILEITDTDLEDFRSKISSLAAENEEMKIKLKKVGSQTQLSANNLDCQHSAKGSMEDFKSQISILAAENEELKIKLKEVGSQTQLSASNEDRQHSAKDLREELRKLKQAYKELLSDTDKEISSLRSEKSFVWNQYNTTDQQCREICKQKNIEVKQATELAQKLQQDLSELQVAAQNKDAEISRLQAEVNNGKERMLILENELQQMRSLVKAKDVETDKHRDEPETSQMRKKDINMASRKSKSEGPVAREKSKNSEVTPCRMQSQSKSNSRMNNKRGQPEPSQKRKRGASSYSTRRCTTRLQVRTSASPMLLFTPSFTIPKLSAAPTPPIP